MYFVRKPASSLTITAVSKLIDCNAGVGLPSQRSITSISTAISKSYQNTSALCSTGANFVCRSNLCDVVGVHLVRKKSTDAKSASGNSRTERLQMNQFDQVALSQVTEDEKKEERQICLENNEDMNVVKRVVPETKNHAVIEDQSNEVRESENSSTKKGGIENQQQSAFFVSPTSREHKSDLIVVLDMDECLIHSQFLGNSSGDVSASSDDYRQYEANRPYEPNNTTNTIRCESFRISLPDGDLVHVNKRPNLDTFLKDVTSKFETHIFTAAMEIYASPVLDVLDPHMNMLNSRFYRESCSLHEDLGVYVKDLKSILDHREVEMIIPKEEDPRGQREQLKKTYIKRLNEQRVVLVDNNPLSFLANPSNGILVSNFYDDPKDNTLPAVLDLLHTLDEIDDVRPHLDKMFGLKDALKDVPYINRRKKE